MAELKDLFTVLGGSAWANIVTQSEGCSVAHDAQTLGLASVHQRPGCKGEQMNWRSIVRRGRENTESTLPGIASTRVGVSAGKWIVRVWSSVR